MWSPTPCEKDSRKAARYQSDVTGKEWNVTGLLLPSPKIRGRLWGWPLRGIVNAIFYVKRPGCPWRLPPSGFPPWSTVYRWLPAWRGACVFEKLNHALVMADRERRGREASPSAAIIGGQSVKTAEAGGPRGYGAGKKVKGRKRHALADTGGRALFLEPHRASVQDRGGGGPQERDDFRNWLLTQPGTYSDPLTEVLRNGARTLLGQAVEAEVAAWLSPHPKTFTRAAHRLFGRTAARSLECPVLFWSGGNLARPKG